jgi:hypothetical protein
LFRYNRFYFAAIIVLNLILATPAYCGSFEKTGNQAKLQQNETQERLVQLEAETNQLRRKLAQLETELTTEIQPNSMTGASAEQFITQTDLQESLKYWAWRKGDFTFTPYGFVLVSTVFDTAHTFPGEIILWVDSLSIHQGNAFYIDAKSTRVGLNMTGPDCCLLGKNYHLKGRVEVDFQGNYLQRNKGTLLFRQGYIDLVNHQDRILFGQSWDVISPLFPGTLNYIPGCAAGNIGYRRPQIRYERNWTPSGKVKQSPKTCPTQTTGSATTKVTSTGTIC